MRNLYEQCLKLTQFAALEFEEIFQFSQERLKQALETELIENGYAVRKQRGFLYAEGTVPVLLVAHLDTVHRTQPETICYSADGTVMMSPQGIGGDDRAGVYIGDAEAFCMDGSAAAYQAGQAKEYKTIEMEEAMRLLEQERAAG